MTYQIKNWGAFYENDRSRATRNCRWCAVPNKQDGLGYSRLVSMPNGPALYGCFVAIVLMASKQEERGGWLTRDGSPPTHGGVPLTPGDIALMVRMPEEIVAATLDACCSDGVAWIESTPNSRPTHAAAPPNPRPTPSEGKEGNGKEGTEKKEGGAGGGAPKAVKFTRPTADEITAYCIDLELPMAEAQKFEDYYQSNGWKVGRNPMKDWKSALRNWKRNYENSGANRRGGYQRPETEAERRRNACGKHGDPIDPTYDDSDANIPFA